ncbi:CmpA/NrtA family ABC transporter substrate-binding protein [uncultured Tateyamaria sp.]|uniref:CmpA/NrtA family ABC transporter substrate-binding protein n=1 Tax=uncultured Tateyamaria sp. TaxID=455651 RepID=UPI002615BF62|nr:CmpA/NrtA family ABC transporter substrate-binding protein [uncultured Tateyamaria sp.]
MMSRPLNCGYVPLVDSAPLIIAKELGFAADEGIQLNLLRQPSWAALRDLLALKHLDVAHMLSPMPVAMSLGLSGPPVQIDAPLVLSANGTVVGVSRAIGDNMRARGWVPQFSDPRATIECLLACRDQPLRVGVPFPYSMHRLLFEYLVEGAQGARSDLISIVTTPPPLMADAVARGDLDLFCVGEPWGTVAVSTEQAELILPGASIWAHAPEKVLGMRRDWAAENDEACGVLLRAVYRAARWLGQAENQPLASEILARSEHLDLPDHAIDPALTGHILCRHGDAPVHIPNFLKFHQGATNFPWRSQGAWIGAQISRLAGLDEARTVQTAADCLRPDLYRRHLATSDADMPGASAKVEGALAHPTAVASTRGEMILGPDAYFDGRTFDFGPL